MCVLYTYFSISMLHTLHNKRHNT